MYFILFCFFGAHPCEIDPAEGFIFGLRVWKRGPCLYGPPHMSIIDVNIENKKTVHGSGLSPPPAPPRRSKKTMIMDSASNIRDCEAKAI